MMNTENVELKPCPFCGGTNIAVERGDVRFNGGFTWNYNMVRCKKCCGIVLVRKEKSAVDVWNSRTTD